jgi:hypothetical protein
MKAAPMTARAIRIAFVALSLSSCGDERGRASKASASADAVHPIQSTSASAAPPTGPLPSEITALLPKPGESKPVWDPTREGFLFSAPEGAKLTAASGGWATMEVAGAKLAVLSHEPSAKSGDICPTMDTMMAKLKRPKDVVSASGRAAPWGRESEGDEVAVWIFEEGGKRGFYGRKVFENVPKKTVYCCAMGEPGEALSLSARGDNSTVHRLAGICMSLTFVF